MKIKILIGFMLLIILILISGCIETSTPTETPTEKETPTVCGNGIIEEGETTENCCIDVGCPDGQGCENNVCVESKGYKEQIILENDTGIDKKEINAGVANPASIYCMKLYPNQPDTFGTCYYVGRADDEYNSVICKGNCGYGCNCLPNCGHPSSEHCQTASEEEIKCICGGGSCERPCFFPDGSECGMWDFYRGKCGQEWSYCKQQGYDMKNLSQNEGWFRGSVCVDENGTKVGNVYDLIKLGERENKSEIYTGVSIGAANPSVIYCMELGYKSKTLTNEKGEYGICIFPDESECETWAFFRGKCGQEWSYCKQQGYDLKNLGQYDGWIRGGICIDKYTKEEVDTIYNLMNLRAKTICKR